MQQIDFPSPIIENATVFIEFMSNIRSQRLDKSPCRLTYLDVLKHCSEVETISNESEQWTFGKMIKELFCRILQNYKDANSFHIIFDSYIEGSLKGGERYNRLNKSKGIVHIAKITASTNVPEQMEKFWTSESNKVKLQMFAKEKILELAKLININVIVSGMIIDNENPLPAAFYNRQDCTTTFVPELISLFEEVDMRIIPHIK